MNDDLNNVLDKFSEILKEKNIDLNNFANTTSNISSNDIDNGDFSLDIETIIKIKEIISRINKNQNSPRNKLLFSLKPFLGNEKQEKLDNYIKIANLLSVMEEMDIGISFLKNKQGHDFILIITLILLIF